jgi:hypothetical protein
VRVFVGYGYNDRDKWIEEYVFPLVIAFGCEVAHGKVAYGGALPDEIIKAIRSSDAMIGFATRREPSGEGLFETHEWVVQELLMAHSEKLPWVEVREEGVVSPGGILEAAGTQHIAYREADRAACLVKIAQALNSFRERTSITMVRLGPASVVEQINAFTQHATFACTCEILRGIRQSLPYQVPVFPMRGGLFVQLRGIARDERVQISISAVGRTWRSDYESLDTVDIQVKE